MSMIAVSRRRLDRDRQLINDIGISRGRTLELEDRSDAAIRHLTVLRRATASGASTCFGRFLAALHHSGRKQKTIERAKYQHLLSDPVGESATPELPSITAIISMSAPE
jgi:hypothetical protein